MADRYVEKIGGDIDFVLLDTVHVHPWETLNFLCVLPFMKNGAYTALHDITLFAGARHRKSLACRYLFASVVSEEKVTPAPETSEIIPNIGAFKVSEDTRKYVSNLFEALVMPWDDRIFAEDLADITAVIMKYYPQEYCDFFCEVLELQEYMLKHPQPAWLSFIVKMRATNPTLFKLLRGIKQMLRL